MLKISPKCTHLLMILRHQFSFRQFLFCLHLRDPVRLHNRGTPVQFCEISHSQDSWALRYGWQGNTEVWNEQGWEGVWVLQGYTGKNQGSAKYSPQAKYSWPVCFCKHPLGDHNTRPFVDVLSVASFALQWQSCGVAAKDAKPQYLLFGLL